MFLPGTVKLIRNAKRNSLSSKDFMMIRSISDVSQNCSSNTTDSLLDEYSIRPHMCDTCGKRFTLLENLNRHQMIHTDERPYLCTYCQKRFRLAQHLKEHIRIHTGEKPYKCNECGRAFCQISNLKSHQKTHTKIKTFRCDVCGKSFRRSFTLKQHRLTHTRNNSKQMEPPKSAPPPLMRKPDLQTHQNLTRKRSAPGAIGPYYSDKKITSSYYSSEPSSGLAMLSAIGAQMSRYSPTNPVSIPHTVYPQSAPYLSNPMLSTFDAPKERFVFPSLTALLSREDNTPTTSGATRPYNSSLNELAGQYYTNHCDTISNQSQSTVVELNADVSAENHNNKELHTCSQCPQMFTDAALLRRHVFKEHGVKRQRSDSAYSSHDDKSLPNSPEMAKKKKLQRQAEIKQESQQSDDDAIKEGTNDKATKSGAKWKQQLCKGWYSHERETTHTNCAMVGTSSNDPTQIYTNISPALVIGTQHEENESSHGGNNLTTECTTATPLETDLGTQTSITQQIFPAQTQPMMFGMERMMPVIEWKPVVTGWRDAVTGCVYPMPSTATQQPTVMAPSTSLQETSPYFKYSPSLAQSFSLASSLDGSISRSLSAQSNISITPSSDEEKYNALRQSLKYNLDSNRARLFGTSSTPADNNLLFAK